MVNRVSTQGTRSSHGTALAVVHDRVVLQQGVTGRCAHALVLSPGPPKSIHSGDPWLPLAQSLKVLR
jgi:hypothetical protein